MILDVLREAFRITKENRAKKRLADEKRRIAKHFNNLYTYRERWDTSDNSRLDGTGMWGFTPQKGYAWMCPTCNKIHLAESCSAMSGLQYPNCCEYRTGHRLYEDLRTK